MEKQVAFLDPSYLISIVRNSSNLPILQVLQHLSEIFLNFISPRKD